MNEFRTKFHRLQNDLKRLKDEHHICHLAERSQAERIRDLEAENRALQEQVRGLELQRDYLAKLLGDLCTTQKDGECPLFYACPASGFGWSCGNAIKEDWIYAAEKAAEEADGRL